MLRFVTTTEKKNSQQTQNNVEDVEDESRIKSMMPINNKFHIDLSLQN